MIKSKTTKLKRSDLSENMKNILTVLQDNKTRSTRDLYQSLAIPVTTLRKALNRLHLFELVDETHNQNGNVWTISKKGLELSAQKDESKTPEQAITAVVAAMDIVSQDTSNPVLLPNEKEAKPDERFTLTMFTFWLRTKAKELADMAEFIDNNKDSIL